MNKPAPAAVDEPVQVNLAPPAPAPAPVSPVQARLPIGSEVLVIERHIWPGGIEEHTHSARVTSHRGSDGISLLWNRKRQRCVIRELFVRNPGTGIAWYELKGRLVTYGVCLNDTAAADKLRDKLHEEVILLLSARLREAIHDKVGPWYPTSR